MSSSVQHNTSTSIYLAIFIHLFLIGVIFSYYLSDYNNIIIKDYQNDDIISQVLIDMEQPETKDEDKKIDLSSQSELFKQIKKYSSISSLFEGLAKENVLSLDYMGNASPLSQGKQGTSDAEDDEKNKNIASKKSSPKANSTKEDKKEKEDIFADPKSLNVFPNNDKDDNKNKDKTNSQISDDMITKNSKMGSKPSVPGDNQWKPFSIKTEKDGNAKIGTIGVNDIDSKQYIINMSNKITDNIFITLSSIKFEQIENIIGELIVRYDIDPASGKVIGNKISSKTPTLDQTISSASLNGIKNCNSFGTPPKSVSYRNLRVKFSFVTTNNGLDVILDLLGEVKNNSLD